MLSDCEVTEVSPGLRQLVDTTERVTSPTEKLRQKGWPLQSQEARSIRLGDTWWLCDLEKVPTEKGDRKQLERHILHSKDSAGGDGLARMGQDLS